MIDTVPPRGHHGHGRLLPEGAHRAWVGPSESGNGTSTVLVRLAVTGRAGPPSTSSVRATHPRPAELPRSGVLVAEPDASPEPLEPRGATPMSGSPCGPVVPAVADAVRSATAPRSTTPITRDALGAAGTLQPEDPQNPITEERLSRVLRKNHSREGMEEHQA